jgi:hypothetical protein
MLLAGIQETNTEHFTHIKHVTITQQRISVISHGRYEVSFLFFLALLCPSTSSIFEDFWVLLLEGKTAFLERYMWSKC